jgi:predicted metalloendopeptidase
MEEATRIKAELKILERQLGASLEHAFGLRRFTPGDADLHQKIERLAAAVKERCSELGALKKTAGGA